jgi:indolepyruvate ferredoxin oxidoreductase, beta subunit
VSSGEVISVVIAGLGGQGVLKASDIVAQAAFLAGLDVKKSEVHGMSQRGGSVASDVRFGARVLSPMVPPGEADYLVLLDAGQMDTNRSLLKSGGILIHPGLIDPAALPSKRSLNVALVGALSSRLSIPEGHWLAAIRSSLSEHLHEANLSAFQVGRRAAILLYDGVSR